MTKNKLDIIEARLKTKNITEYEIFLTESNIFESIFLKNRLDNEREITNSDYILRILNQKDNETGIGVIKGNALDPYEIDNNIESCVRLSKSNTSPKYTFPEKKKISKFPMVDKKILNNPNGVKKDISEELIKVANEQKEVTTTFGRFRIHLTKSFLKNSNELNLQSSKTFFFIEFALKAEKNGRLAEYWTVRYYKEKEHLNLEQRVKDWARFARDTLTAKLPKSKSNATVIFPPHVLAQAINPVLGLHALGKAHYEKVSAYTLDSEVASNNFSLIDNGLLKGGLNSGSWDGEGNPHQKTEVITRGVFKNRLYDQKYALLENTESTGNGSRRADGPVINGLTNSIISPGNISLDEMISKIEEGYYIENFSWLNPDPLSGFFGAEIRNGYYIQNGEFKDPIKLGNASGNVLQMIKNCLFISKEREFVEDTLFPYIAFKDINISS